MSFGLHWPVFYLQDTQTMDSPSSPRQQLSLAWRETAVAVREAAERRGSKQWLMPRQRCSGSSGPLRPGRLLWWRGSGRWPSWRLCSRPPPCRHQPPPPTSRTLPETAARFVWFPFLSCLLSLFSTSSFSRGRKI